MLKRWAAWPTVIRWLVAIATLVLAAVILWALFEPLPDLLARHDVGSAKPALVQTARDAARGRLLTLAAGLFAAGALVFTALNFSLSRRTFELTEQGQVTDRFTKAIEQLGSDKFDVRLGGIYALERIARDSAKDHPTVMEVLAAFIREHSHEQWPPSDPGRPVQERSIRPDVQAAVSVVGRRDAKRDILNIQLTRADLTGAILFRANLADANLTDANLTRADLTRANLTDAYLIDANLTDARLIVFVDLTRADLTRADLTRADLTDARLTDARLIGANLTDARLTDARLIGANLTRTDLTSANLTGADLTGANLTDADLTNLTRTDLTSANLNTADLTGANLTRANLTRADLTGARWPEGAQVPDGWTVDSGSGRLKRADELSEVTAHYL